MIWCVFFSPTPKYGCAGKSGWSLATRACTALLWHWEMIRQLTQLTFRHTQSLSLNSNISKIYCTFPSLGKHSIRKCFIFSSMMHGCPVNVGQQPGHHNKATSTGASSCSACWPFREGPQALVQ